jgi:hypothetical protein
MSIVGASQKCPQYEKKRKMDQFYLTPAMDNDDTGQWHGVDLSLKGTARCRGPDIPENVRLVLLVRIALRVKGKWS